jgi:C1A family cysteine protease
MKPRSSLFVVGLMVAIVAAGSQSAERAWAQSGPCVGDCNDDDAVTIDELITGVSIALGTQLLTKCPTFDSSNDGAVSVAEVVVGVNNALAGCGSQANRAPQADDVSLSTDDSTAYVEKQLIAHDPDNDTITYELIAGDTGNGYLFAYVNPDSGVLYLILAPDFHGTIVLPYHATDGKLFSNTADATIQVQAITQSNETGANPADPRVYAGFERGYYDGTLLGAPGAAPTLPSAVDLSKDFPIPASQGQQSSCVGWATAYALKTYQERVEIGWSLEPAEHKFSPAYIYNQINHGRDNGSQIYDALDLVVTQGVATFATMPYSDQDFLTQPSTAARQEAAQFKGKSWKTANGTMEIKDALANRLPVVVAILVFDDFLHLQGPNSVYNTFGTFQGSHAVTIVGYDDDRYGGAFKIINSWSQNWGAGGYFWMPYTVANQVLSTPYGFLTALQEAYVLQDMENTMPPPPDPVDPPRPAELPDLQVTDWKANFDGRPGGSGSLQYTVTNTGVATAPAGAFVALILSHDPTFTSTSTLVVYERIPFEMPPGTTAFRDQNNSIAFNFPDDVAPGQYYMGVWADIWNDVLESNEGNNISPAMAQVNIVNTLPDMQVLTWYSTWDAFGFGLLTYEVVNNGASSAPAGWLITLALSPNDIIGDGDEIFLFSEPANFDIGPGGTLYRDNSSPGSFSIFFDYFGNRVPTGVYYLALWLDPNNFLAESNEINNASLSWGTVNINSGLSSNARSSGKTDSIAPGEAYNGKILPGQGSMRKVRISATPQGGRRMEFLTDGESSGSGPRLKAPASHGWSKLARARQQVIFPVAEMKPMPNGN